jgi:hypothetical protein
MTFNSGWPISEILIWNYDDIVDNERLIILCAPFLRMREEEQRLESQRESVTGVKINERNGWLMSFIFSTWRIFLGGKVSTIYIINPTAKLNGCKEKCYIWLQYYPTEDLTNYENRWWPCTLKGFTEPAFVSELQQDSWTLKWDQYVVPKTGKKLPLKLMCCWPCITVH